VPRGADHLQQPIILFDGICNLCEWWSSLSSNATSRPFSGLLPLQSQTAQRLMAQYGLCPASVRTMVLIDGGIGLYQERCRPQDRELSPRNVVPVGRFVYYPPLSTELGLPIS
jgi:hypothetical protein